MKAIIIGAGRIGRGYVSELLLLNNVDIVLYDASDETVDLLNEKKEYTIHVLGNTSNDLLVKNVIAYNVNNVRQLALDWNEANYLFTSCGGKNLPVVGKNIADAYKLASQKNPNHIVNIVTCENWPQPIKDLSESISIHLDAKEKELFNKHVGIAESVIVATGTGAPASFEQKNPMDTWVQDVRYLPIDSKPLIGELPNWKYFEFIDNFGNLLIQKMYTNNTSGGSACYLGHLKGLKLMAECSNDVEIEPIMDGIYQEVNKALINGLKVDEQLQIKLWHMAKAKYTDWTIEDPVVRTTRDPLRKLAPNDRYIGPMRLALYVGIKPYNIALGTAAALYYENDEDPSAIKLAQMRKEHGIDYVLQSICQLKKESEEVKLIHQAIGILKEKGWIKK